jgi:hypothetical protein
MAGICEICGEKTSRKEYLICRNCRTIKNKSFTNVKEYRREWHQIKKYGIDEGGFSLLWQIAEGKCNICGIDLIMPPNVRGQPLNAAVIDHDHETGNLRGLLCNGCNKGLGLFKENSNILINAAKWVSKNE